MSKRDAFLAATCKEKVEDFLQFIKRHNDKTDPFNVEEVVQEMSRDQRQSLWGKLASLLQEVLQELPPERWNEPRQEEEGEEGMEQEQAADPKHVMAVVDGVALVAAMSVKVLQDDDVYSALLDTVHRLHDVLVSLPVSEAPVQLHIHALCEAWWKKDLREKEVFGRTALLLSLQKSLVLKKNGVEVQRVWGLHPVLLCLDYTSEDNMQIIDLLLQCFHNLTFIRNDDGKRFLVFLFSWNIRFIFLIHSTIKNQMEFFSRTTVSHIKEIYFRAWKKASGDFLEEIETSCVQDFMQNAIFLHRDSPVHSKVRQIMSYFHSKKGCHQVDKMLHSLYKPILWKSLHAANFEVRANATLLFTEAFPIHDPEQNNRSVDEAIQKQLDIAMRLLDDSHPTVRSSAVLGVCKILAKCWEMLPATVITDFLKKMLTELVNDSSSPDVRCSTFKCLTIVLDNPLSHPVLEKLLPTLKFNLHDTSEKVRIAFLDMLVKVKAVRAAKFWDVCSMDHLLARLALDSPSVSKRIVDLLFKSFFPVNESDQEWRSRCITLVQMNPAAARKFYLHVHKHTAATNIIKLMLAIRRMLNSYVDFDSSETMDSNKENSVAAPPPLLGKDMVLVARLLEVVVILWRSIQKALAQNEEAQKYTIAKFASVMSKYFQTFEDEQCTGPLIQLASFMPPAAVPTFSVGVLSRLRRMDPAAAPAQFSLLLDCLCSWGQARDVLELLTEWLSEPLPKPKEKESSRRRVQIQETVEAKPDLALSFLEHLLSHGSSREKLLALGEKPLKQLHTVLGNWRSVLYIHLSKSTEEPQIPGEDTALRVFTYHGRLGAHLHHHSSEGRDYLLSLENMVSWVGDKVLPFLSKRHDDQDDDEEEEEEKKKKDLERSQLLAARITESFLTVCRDVVLVGLADEKLKGQILRLCSLSLLAETGYCCIPAVLLVLKEVVDSCVLEEEQQEQQEENNPTLVLHSLVANIFQKIIELLAQRVRKEPEEGKQLCQSAVPSLSGFVQVAQGWDTPPLRGVFSTLFAVSLVENKHLLQKMSHPEEVMPSQSLEDMPPLSNILLSVILKSPAVTRAFLTEVTSSLDSEAIRSLNELAAVLHILLVIRHAGQTKPGLKAAATSAQQQLHRHTITSVKGTDVQRAIYESSVKILNEILDF